MFVCFIGCKDAFAFDKFYLNNLIIPESVSRILVRLPSRHDEKASNEA
jgi:hypothetical protein